GMTARVVGLIRSGTSGFRQVVRSRMRQWRRKRLARQRMRSRHTYALLAGLLVLAGLLLAALSFLGPHPAGQRVSLDRLQAYVAAKQVVSTTFQDEDANVVAVIKPVMKFLGTSAQTSRSTNLAPAGTQQAKTQKTSKTHTLTGGSTNSAAAGTQ